MRAVELDGAYHERGYVFPSPTGGPLDPDLLSKAWRRLCRVQGVEYRLHDLRHAHATTLIEEGSNIKAVQARLGHSSPSLTMAVYAHVSPGMDKAAADAYAKAMLE
ncbi:MAG: tyrosine-type recombinase/integrase [Anaerolineae bacterium]